MTTYRNTVLIYNPRAGRFGRSGRAPLTRAVEILTGNGHNITVAPTTGPNMAGEIAREHIARGADLILAAGGDGTINEVAEGMVCSNVPLGVLPAGTANVLAMEMGLGSRLERVAEGLERFTARRISLGRLVCEDGRVTRYFLLMAGIGLDAHVVYHISAPLKSRTGKFAYWVAGWRLLGRNLAEFHIDVNGRRRQCSFALISKVRNYGGDFEIARTVSLFDAEFEIVLFEGKSSLRYVRYFLGMILNRLNGASGVTVLRAPRAVVYAPEDRRVYVQIDGEYAGHLPAEVSIVPNALTLLVPPDYVRRVQ